MQKETDNKSLRIDPYCCRITIIRADKIGPVTVGHVRFPDLFIPQGGLEIKLLLHFTHPVEHILENMKELTNKQLARLEETFNFNESYNENDDD